MKPFITVLRRVSLGVVMLYALGALAASTREACAEQRNNAAGALTGVWESKETTMGGLGAIYEFRKDGGWVGSIGALVDGAYDLQDPKLQQYAPHPEGAPSGGEERPRKVMEGHENAPPFAGVWKYRHYTGGYAYERILPDGRFMLRVPFPIPWGRYEIKGKTLRLIEPGCPAVEVRFRVTDTALELTAPNKKPIKLMRVQPTWYHALTESEVEEAKANIENIQKEMGKKQQVEENKGYEILR